MGDLSPTYLEHAIWLTLRYYDILARPLTATQLWRCLLVPPTESTIRWEGHHLFSLVEVREALAMSEWLREQIDHQWGYFFLRGRTRIVEQYLARFRLAQAKWKILQRTAKFMAAVPFVQSIMASGSLSLNNTRPQSDLDVIIIARRGRIWTTRLLLLLLLHLLGRRRRYWDQEAPDKVCLNHYLADDTLQVPPAIRSVYTAVLYTHLVPLFGFTSWQAFQDTNAFWLRRFVMVQTGTPLQPVQAIHLRRPLRLIRRQLEALLLEPVGAVFERWAERVQRYIIGYHDQQNLGGRIVLSHSELAFHPHSKADIVLQQFTQEPGQQALF